MLRFPANYCVLDIKDISRIYTFGKKYLNLFQVINIFEMGLCTRYYCVVARGEVWPGLKTVANLELSKATPSQCE